MDNLEAIIAYIVFAAAIIGIIDLARWAMNKVDGMSNHIRHTENGE